ncbi:PH domain-containing protein [Patescibacteria group bacterium]|nr:PH domain-containing protein [Patescibacteria group bacterium]MBU1889909.1 PH domain-containing protein [Patescibacteria group bacterium]
MLDSYFIKHLKEGEEAVRVVRRHYMTYAFQIFVSVIIVLIPFFFMWPLFRLGAWGVFGFVLIILVGIFYFWRQTIIYYMNGLVITKNRIIDFDQRGLFERVVSETTYDKIQDVSFSIKGFLPTILNFGDLGIQTAGTQANLEIKSIDNPKEIQDVIVNIQKDIIKQPENLTAQELVNMISKIKEGIGEERFKELVNQTKQSSKNKTKQ